MMYGFIKKITLYALLCVFALVSLWLIEIGGVIGSELAGETGSGIGIIGSLAAILYVYHKLYDKYLKDGDSVDRVSKYSTDNIFVEIAEVNDSPWRDNASVTLYIILNALVLAYSVSLSALYMFDVLLEHGFLSLFSSMAFVPSIEGLNILAQASQVQDDIYYVQHTVGIAIIFFGLSVPFYFIIPVQSKSFINTFYKVFGAFRLSLFSGTVFIMAVICLIIVFFKYHLFIAFVDEGVSIAALVLLAPALVLFAGMLLVSSFLIVANILAQKYRE